MISAKTIADSISIDGKRLTTLELEYPRFIHCFHVDTEFLSQVGDEFPEWRSYEAIVNLSAKVAQYTPEGDVISFVEPTDSIKKKSEKLVVSRKKTNPFAVTPEHRMFSFRRTTGNVYKPHVDKAQDWVGSYSGHRRIPKAGFLDKGEVSLGVTGDEAALIAFYVADGHKPKNGSQVVFHFRKERKVNRVVYLLKKLSIDFTYKQYGKEYVIRFDAPSWVADCYTLEGAKKYPDFIWNMSNSSFISFKQAVLESDGYAPNNQMSTTSLLCATQVQILALLNGVGMNIRSYDKGNGKKSVFQQNFFDSGYASYRSDKDVVEEIDYNGDVVCFSVPSSFLVVRYKGCAFISGNCQIKTHRMLSTNSASSRAVPVEKVIERVKDDPVRPSFWGKNKRGMAAVEEEINTVRCWGVKVPRNIAWDKAMLDACTSAEAFADAGYHKQIVNRLTEPFQYIKTVVTATEWDNFFRLRLEHDAQPEIQELAQRINEAITKNEPILLNDGDWHVPYFEDGFLRNDEREHLEEAKMISASCCAQVSYRSLDDSLVKAHKIYKMLSLDGKRGNPHFSPVEHQATPMTKKDLMLPFDKLKEKGISHVDMDYQHWSGNFKGWVQNRKLIEYRIRREN